MANSADPDQVSYFAISDLGLHCLLSLVFLQYLYGNSVVLQFTFVLRKKKIPGKLVSERCLTWKTDVLFII